MVQWLSAFASSPSQDGSQSRRQMDSGSAQPNGYWPHRRKIEWRARRKEFGRIVGIGVQLLQREHPCVKHLILLLYGGGGADTSCEICTDYTY